MKKFLLPCLAAFALASCESNSDKPLVKDATTEAATTPAVVLPVQTDYKGTPSTGKAENLVTVMNWNKNMIDGKVEEACANLADSITVTLADGTAFNMSKDSATAMLKGWRANITAATQSYFSAIPVDNKDMGDEWVIQWTTEKYTMKDGTKDENNICEAYLLKGGKIRRISQYAQKIPKVDPAR